MKGMDNTSLKFISAFVLIVLGLAFLSTIATSAQDVTTASVFVTQEPLNIASARTTDSSVSSAVGFTLLRTGPSYTPGLVSTSIKLYNASGTIINAGNYTYDATTRTLSLVNNSYWTTSPGSDSNTTLATYQSYPSGYLTQGWDATVTNLIPGFFALSLLGVGIWLFYSAGKDLSIF